MLVGLGNPGPDYDGTRHNIGFQVLDEIHRHLSGDPWKAKFGADVAEASLRGDRVILCKPLEFMNTSGQPVAKAAAFWKVATAQIVVAHDDLDLPFGRLKLGAGGGHGGHNGLRSLISCVGADFLRVRIGIDRPPPMMDPANYVLARFSKVEQKDVPSVVSEAALASQQIIEGGLSAAMNRFNTKKNPNP